jgi:DegV family protein with EDD domain
VRIVTNPGSNLSPALIERYGIALTAQQIVADGAHHDTRALSTVEHVDALVRSAKAHPHILGTSASELVALFREAASRTRELVVVCTSRKLIGTYDAALAATRTLQSMPVYSDMHVSVIDSTLTDLGAGLVTLFCAESALMRKPRREIAEAARGLGERGCFYFVPSKFDYLLASGRASFMKAMTAQLLGKLPIITAHNGELHNSGTMQKSGDIPQTLLMQATKDYPLRQSIFAAITHAKHKDEADQLEALLREHYDVKCLIKRELAPAIYLATGEGLGLIIMPAKGLPWQVELPSETWTL